MRAPIQTLCLALALLSGLSAWPGACAHAGELASRLLQQAPGLKPEVLELALSARLCAQRSGQAPKASRLAVIDYSLPSTEPRLWVFDLPRKRLLYAEHVAHGRGSGENLATEFSNIEGSHQTSLGLFVTDQTYHGANGYSLRMDGLDPGFNDLARVRAIVMHGAPYVDPLFAQEQGRLGRSLGCPAVRSDVARPLINHLRDGQLLFAYYPDPQLLAQASSLSCLRQARAEHSGMSGVGGRASP
ncbi:murein L,D-transpeptidase catalytic domain family protein [Aquimonas sp.]|uniref:murein L,D-transpeptidase catalytic domain family protein n=1 Tax=Aquimonas sp. TaxID=1872588 RepID=UPI0037BE7747